MMAVRNADYDQYKVCHLLLIAPRAAVRYATGLERPRPCTRTAAHDQPLIGSL